MSPSGQLFLSYPINQLALDEVFVEADMHREYYEKIIKHFSDLDVEDYSFIHEYSKSTFFNQGITFNVYADSAQGQERVFPFDLFPRIIPRTEWNMLEEGVRQRNQALNLFLGDVYLKQHIFKDKIIPYDMIASSDHLCEFMHGFTPEGGIYVHISGTDLIKHSDGKWYVLEDNLRCPSGVSYVLANRETMKKTFPNLFHNYHVLPVNEYPEHLNEAMLSFAPENNPDPTCVLLTPGMYNSAYYEHAFLASQMGIQLVEGRDLFVEKDVVYMKTIHGPRRVDVVYRRIDDDFLDPEMFKPDSLLGVKGLMRAYLLGNVVLMNAPGTGVADDKAIYSYVPDMIRYYLQEEPILNNVQTYRCIEEMDCQFVLENMDKLVVKPVDESGGYGILMGHKATREEIDAYRKRIRENPRKYIAQPVMSLSMHSTFIESDLRFEPRHIDLRIFSIMGKNDNYVCQGGLTRVALRKGNLIVNSSQGGGSKDTWVLEN